MRKRSFIPPVIALILFCFLSCKKEYDSPPVKPIETGTRINIAMIKSKFISGTNYRFKSDSNLYCVVTADEVSGNLYKEIYVKDATGAIHINFLNSGGYFIGDSIRINLNGAILNENNKLIQLDSVDSEKKIVKLASGYLPVATVLTIPQIIANTTQTNSVQSKLVRIENVEFVSADQNQYFSDAIGKTGVTRILRSCDGQTLSVRTSGYSSLAGKLTPSGNGNITGIVSQSGNNMRVLLRNISDVNMDGPLCPPTPTVITYLTKDFEDNSLTSDGWTNANVTGTINWSIGTSTNSSNPSNVIQCNNYLGPGNQPACETWLISRAIDLSASSVPAFSFMSARTFDGQALQTLISTNYLSGAPSTATWSTFNAVYGSSTTFVSSGAISLISYKTANVRIAFKYTGSLNSGSKWQIDNIKVFEQ